jgi:hypothetical protein
MEIIIFQIMFSETKKDTTFAVPNKTGMVRYHSSVGRAKD